MSSHRLRRLHHRVGIELEQGETPEVGALALHFARAGVRADADRAIAYALSAGAQATEMVAHEEAAVYYERALEVLARAHPDAAERRLALLLELGQAHVRAGERPAAWKVFVEAAELADALGDADALTQAAIGGVVALHAAAGSRRRGADRAAGARDRGDRGRRRRWRGCCCWRGCVERSTTRPRRDEMAALSREATALAARARRSAGDRAGGRRATARRLAAGQPRRPAGRLDRDPAGGGAGGQPGADDGRQRVAGRGSARAGRPSRRRCPDGGVRGGRASDCASRSSAGRRRSGGR